ncbi:hypothetical protein [Desulfomarina sp.]
MKISTAATQPSAEDFQIKLIKTGNRTARELTRRREMRVYRTPKVNDYQEIPHG